MSKTVIAWLVSPSLATIFHPHPPGEDYRYPLLSLLPSLFPKLSVGEGIFLSPEVMHAFMLSVEGVFLLYFSVF